MRLALAYLVQNPELAETVEQRDEFAGSDIAGIDIFLELVDFCAARPYISTAQLLETWPDPASRAHLVKLATWDLPGEPELQALEFRDAVTGLKLQWVDSQLAKLPRIVDQSPEEREQNLALSRTRHELRNRLQGQE